MNFLKLFALAFVIWTGAAHGDELIMARSGQNFEDAMNTLQAAIKRHGYTVSKVQRVDVGLEAKGYKTDRYRIVFYGKAEEVEMLAEKYPQMIPYLPLNIVIFAEVDNTILTAIHPALFKQLFPEPELMQVFSRWEKDLNGMMDDVREGK